MPISNSSKGEERAKLFNEMGYDAMAVGNHEFDFGLDEAKKYKEILNFPLLSSNTYVNGARLFEASTIVDKDKNLSFLLSSISLSFSAFRESSSL